MMLIMKVLGGWLGCGILNDILTPTPAHPRYEAQQQSKNKENIEELILNPATSYEHPIVGRIYLIRQDVQSLFDLIPNTQLSSPGTNTLLSSSSSVSSTKISRVGVGVEMKDIHNNYTHPHSTPTPPTPNHTSHPHHLRIHPLKQLLFTDNDKQPMWFLFNGTGKDLIIDYLCDLEEFDGNVSSTSINLKQNEFIRLLVECQLFVKV